MISFYVEVIVFLLGLCIGSFLNVCIYRLPLSKPIPKPSRSVCPDCGSIIRFYDNIPVVSYLLLKRRCRHCGFIIPFRYPLVEISGGLFALLILKQFGLSLYSFVYFVFIAVLIVVTFIDLDHRIIPDVITLPGIPIFFGLAFLLPESDWVNSVLGILVGGGSLLTVAWVYALLTGKEGMGGGDIKLLAMAGALVGWKGVLFTIFVSSAAGALIGIILMLRTRKGLKLAVPFGPFIALGAVVYVFFGPVLINWYFNLL
ncbi:leader peptidase (prepilin peptidase) / N-methyltransferase [Desulfosarcina sp. BuS5]|uniref:prepilin peptidase n=1 Tax=Desulfosarcina sp. BuS5 TaxID=933262 RepID=UPI0004892E3E|nr:A24 family peptidase [Desulfosarcina sp. BuS5]WDN89252.1 leader peptidase (prepilin peptidase) / N-methyltransferase [Desulfosarcina sp. BuS5]